MIRVFLDANILFSAAYRETNGILRLWQLREVSLVTSTYAFMEAERNIALKRPEASERFSRLSEQVEISTAARPLSEDHRLPEKDRPILEAAAGSGCLVLLTGDIAHFGHLIGETVDSVRILTASMFLAEDRLRKDVDIGIDQIERGMYTEYSPNAIPELANEIKTKARMKLTNKEASDES